MFAELKSRTLVNLTGPETEAFLQGLVSNDMADLGTEARSAALLSAQGKILFDLIILAEPGGFLLDCEAARADELIAKLKVYRLRAKIEIARDPRSVFARFRPPFAGLGLGDGNVRTVNDPRLAALGQRVIGDAATIHKSLAAAGVAEGSEEQYAADRRLAGVPEGAGELGIEKLFLLEGNAEELHGVDFQKGCYVGQELTSRMKRKAEIKKRLLPLRLSGEAPAGAPVTAAGDLIGSVVGGGPGLAFALLRLDRLAQARAADTPLDIEGKPAHIHPPAYLAGKI